MKNYKDYEMIYLGCSDVAALVLAGCRGNEGMVTECLNFGEDGCYSAYLVDDEAEIGNHYKLVSTFNYWLTVYDDSNCTYKIRANEIKIYRAGAFGCIVQVIK